MGKFLFSLSVIILTHCSQDSSQNNNKDNKSTPPKFNNNRILNDIDKILGKNESLNKIVKDWCKKNDVSNKRLITFIKSIDDKNFSRCFPNNKYPNINIDERIKDTKVLADFEHALKKLLTSIKKQGKELIMNNSDEQEFEEFDLDNEILKILDNYNYVRARYQRNLSEFDEYVKKIKNKNNNRIINVLTGNTNSNMTTVDRTCGCEFYFILTKIMINLSAYIDGNRDYDWHNSLNKTVAIYNNNINNFKIPQKIRDKIIKYVTEDTKQRILTEFEKIINQKSDYGKISAEELKKAEEEFFKL